MGMEIERKWRMKAAPAWLERFSRKEMRQGYLCTAPVVRIREEGEEYLLTYKGKGRLVREEYNLPLTADAFRHLLPKCDGIILQKTRYYVPLDSLDMVAATDVREETASGLTLEIDVFHGVYEGLVFLEVEFGSEEDAMKFCAPEWFGEEVTWNPSYSNAALISGDFMVRTG